MRSILSSSFVLAAAFVAFPALAQKLPAVPGYPHQIARCGDQLETAVAFDCLTGSYQAAFSEWRSPFAPAMSIWTHNHNNPQSFLKNSGDSRESFSPAIKSHVVWSDFHLRVDGSTGGSEININRMYQHVSLTPESDRFPQIADLGGCCGSGVTWQTANSTWDVMYRSVGNGLGNLVGVGDDPRLSETRPVISAARGPYTDEIGGEVTMAWQAAELVDHNFPYMPPHQIQWAILDVPGNPVAKDTIPSPLDARHPAIDGTLVCYDASRYGDIDRRVYCRDISNEEHRIKEDDKSFLVANNEKCASYSRPRVSKNGRFVIYLAEECDSQESERYKQLHMTDLDTGNAYVVVEDFGNGLGDCWRHHSNCIRDPRHYGAYFPDSQTATRAYQVGDRIVQEEVPTHSMHYRYDIHDDMIVYSNYSEDSTKSCIEEYGDLYDDPNLPYSDFDLHYYLIDTASL